MSLLDHLRRRVWHLSIICALDAFVNTFKALVDWKRSNQIIDSLIVGFEVRSRDIPI